MRTPGDFGGRGPPPPPDTSPCEVLVIELDRPERPPRMATFDGLGVAPASDILPSRFVTLKPAGGGQAGANDPIIGISQPGAHDAPGLPGSTGYAASPNQPLHTFS